MNNVQLSPVRFRKLLERKGFTLSSLARLTEIDGSHMWGLADGKYTTSFDFLDRLVPVFGRDEVADIIADEVQGGAFVRWYNANRKTA